MEKYVETTHYSEDGYIVNWPYGFFDEDEEDLDLDFDEDAEEAQEDFDFDAFFNEENPTINDAGFSAGFVPDDEM